MKTKTVNGVDVIYGTECVSIAEAGKISAQVTVLIQAEVEKHGLDICGDWIFISYGRDGDPSKKIVHEFCLPVANTAGYKGSFKSKRLADFFCAYCDYKGDMSPRMLGGKGYGPLVSEIIAASKEFTGESREVYHKWISPKSKENEFEIQFGIKP